MTERAARDATGGSSEWQFDDAAAVRDRLVGLLAEHVPTVPMLVPTQRGVRGAGFLAKRGLGDATYDRAAAFKAVRDYVRRPPSREGDSGSSGAAECDGLIGVAALLAAPGVGKTHLCDDIARLDATLPLVLDGEQLFVDGDNRHLLAVPVTFANGGMQWTPKSHESAALAVWPRVELLVRVVFAHFVGVDRRSDDRFAAVARAIAPQLPRELTVRHVLDALAYDRAQALGVTEDTIHVLLVVDELLSACDSNKVYRDAVDALHNARRGCVVSTLEQTPVLRGEQVGGGATAQPDLTGSRRPLRWLPLPMLDTFAWCKANGVRDETQKRLYVLSSGHPRTMQFVREAIRQQPHAAAIAIIGAVNGTRAGRAPTTVVRFMWAALANVPLPFVAANRQPTKFATAVQAGNLINGVVASEHVPPPAVPLVSLFDVLDVAEPWLRALPQLVWTLVDKLDGKAFERVHVLHTAAMFALHNLARRNKMELGTAHVAALRLFDIEPTGANVLFGGAHFLHVPAGSTIEEMAIDVSEAQGIVHTVTDNLWTAPDGGWTHARDGDQLLPRRGAGGGGGAAGGDDKLALLDPLQLVYTTYDTNEAFDSAVVVPTTAGTPHLVLFENKFSRADAKNKFTSDDMLLKVRKARTRLDELFGDEKYKRHPFRRAGISNAAQVTLCFVVLRHHSVSVDTLESKLLDENDATPIAFNVVLLDHAALVQHYGHTLAPSVALCEHVLNASTISAATLAGAAGAVARTE